jgi:hypothetical protein
LATPSGLCCRRCCIGSARLRIIVDGQGAGLLDGAEDNRGARVAHAGNDAELLEDVLQVLRVAGAHLHQVRVLARGVVGFQHAGNARQRLADVHGANAFVGPHEGEGGEGEANVLGAKHGLEAADDAFALQLAHAFQHGRGGHADRAGDIRVGGAAVILQNAQDCHVDFVDHSVHLPFQE